MTPLPSSTPLSRSAARVGTAFLFLMALAGLAACGGGGGSGQATVPPVDTSLVVSPATVEANANTPLRIEGGMFIPPVRVLLVDAAGAPVGPLMDGVVRDQGRRVDVDSPVLAHLDEDADCFVQVRDGAGRVARSERPLHIRSRGNAVAAIDGSDHTPGQPTWGQAGIHLRLDVPSAHGDGISTPAGASRPSARAVSNAVCAQAGDVPSATATDLFWLWGQFLDHDIDLTPEAEPHEAFPIAVPAGDVHFDPFATGTQEISLDRSLWDPATGTDAGNPRRNVNVITSWIDASNVYGSDAVRAAALRMGDGSGRLRVSAGNLLPFNDVGLPNAPSPAPGLFLAGDVRCNENVGLISLHTLFLREHNRVADELSARNPHLDGDAVYEAARQRVTALLQVITEKEFLPLLLGGDGIGDAGDLDTSRQPDVGVLFSTAAYRFGHTMVSSTLWRLDAAGAEVPDGHLALRDAFFTVDPIVDEGGIAPILRGAAAKAAQALDPMVVDDLRNFLFGPPGAGGLDLAALNIQRGRDHGLPGYNACRVARGLPARTTFPEVSSNPDVVSRLQAAYASVDDIDAWVGALCEDPRPGALVGELLHDVLSDQFRRLRDADRFWYTRRFHGDTRRELARTRLADVIRRNTEIGNEIQDRVMQRVGVPATAVVAKPGPMEPAVARDPHRSVDAVPFLR